MQADNSSELQRLLKLALEDPEGNQLEKIIETCLATSVDDS